MTKVILYEEEQPIEYYQIYKANFVGRKTKNGIKVLKDRSFKYLNQIISESEWIDLINSYNKHIMESCEKEINSESIHSIWELITEINEDALNHILSISITSLKHTINLLDESLPSDIKLIIIEKICERYNDIIKQWKKERKK